MMRWSKVLVAVLGGGLFTALGSGLVTGCQLLVTFETVPEGSGGGTSSTTITGGDGGATAAGGGGMGGGATTTSICPAECCSDTDCPALADPCKQAVCSVGLCAEEPVPEGGDAAVQIEGDCKKIVCQSGAAVVLEDAADLLDDGNDCTVDMCSNSAPDANPVPPGTMCTSLPGGGVCDGKGKCVECVNNEHCPPDAPRCDTNGRVCVPLTCDDNQTSGAETDENCGGPECSPCQSGDTCLVGADCLSGVCSLVSGECANPSCADGLKNGNEGDVDCGDQCPSRCAPGKGCDSNNDCAGDQCTGQGGVCVPNCKDEAQDNLESDVDCGGPLCERCPPGKACGGLGANCLSGDCGPDGTCQPGQPGTPCATDEHCVSLFCTDGVCCDENCGGLCRSCKLPGSVGTCVSIPAGQDPNNECSLTMVCDGNGNCVSP